MTRKRVRTEGAAGRAGRTPGVLDSFTAEESQRERDAELLDRIGRSRIETNERRRLRRNFWVAFGFMVPAVALVSGLLLAPVVYNIYLSFTKWKRFKGLDQFAGAANYEKLATHRLFGDALYNTSLWVVASIIFPLAIGFGLAIFLRGVVLENTFKSVIFLPRILAPTAVGVIWFYVYAPDGVVNRFLSFAAGDTVDIGWLYEENTVTPAIIATFVWQTVGLVMVLLLLGLAAIPKDPLEAARIANVAAGLVVMKRGTATVPAAELRAALEASA